MSSNAGTTLLKWMGLTQQGKSSSDPSWGDDNERYFGLENAIDSRRISWKRAAGEAYLESYYPFDFKMERLVWTYVGTEAMLRLTHSPHLNPIAGFGNTCYCNSVLQALYYCKPFREIVYNFPNGPAPLLSSLPSLTTTSSNTSMPSSPPPTNLSFSSLPSNGSSMPQSTPKLMSKQSRGGPPPLLSGSGVPSTMAMGPEREREKVGGQDLQSVMMVVPGMEDTMFSSLKDLFWKIANQKKKTGVVAPNSFVNKLKKENGEGIYILIWHERGWNPETVVKGDGGQREARAIVDHETGGYVWCCQGGIENLSPFIVNLFRSSMHQDAHEFLNYLLNAIAENVEDYQRKIAAAEQQVRRERERSPSTNGATADTASVGGSTGSEESGQGGFGW
ncbi:LOW QUALITY PROTEIN: hypothetical protein BC936DRAFT_141663 [Jimgerdemannia flammicorona]|uniref:ubiquitinyl hydrolase 1 n=1 Tax=Jimgerdemannia flammicorona TaxID=994334 RepID=A0A433A1U4_9FUNG|nr:LOW QUALITY PROTEIN: hypothetical protein BC936DRAFT_141663 [Jimgerdemannia flammicorona]